MGFKMILLGIVALFGIIIGFAMGFLNMIPPGLAIITMAAFGIPVSLAFMIINMQLGDIISVFLEAKAKNSVVAAMVTPAGNINLLTGDDEEGFILTKKGYITIPRGTVYTWPCGVKGGFGYLRLGTLLHPKIVESATALKKKGFENIKQVEAANEYAKSQGKEIAVKIDRGFDEKGQ